MLVYRLQKRLTVLVLGAGATEHLPDGQDALGDTVSEGSLGESKSLTISDSSPAFSSEVV
jgi:hypothetical protein